MRTKTEYNPGGIMILYLLFMLAYNLAQHLLLPVLALYFLYRKFKGKSVFGCLHERLGFVPCAPRGKKVVWIHAVSVGESLATEFLLNKINAAGNSSYLTFGTLGAQRVTAQLPAQQRSFIPYDFFLPMLLCFLRIKPKQLIIIEAERWPNMMLIARLLRVPCIILNARVAEKAVSKHPLMQWFTRMQYAGVKQLYTQSEHDAQLFKNCGIPADKISVLGNIKTANVLAKIPASTETSHHYFILMAGSIHPTEDTVYLEVMQRIKQHDPFFKLLLLPRHFHWLPQLEAATKATGFSFTVVHEKKSVQEVLDLFARYDIVIIATIGMMFALYEIASMFALGGTFVPVGGHNLLEPAVWGKACVVGPDVHCTRDVAEQLKQHGALIQVADAQHCADEVEALINNPDLTAEMGRRAQRWLENEGHEIDARIDAILLN